MKSPQCRTRWHERCLREIENDDGSAYVCECDCHQRYSLTAPYYGVVAQSIADVAGPILFPDPEGAPPPHPLPYDHGKYRVAEEPQGTDLNLPWHEARCTECREKTWAKSTIPDVICESCAYNLLCDHYDELAKRQRRWNNNQPPPTEL